MLPDDSPDSHNDIGRIRSRAILPVPVWLISSIDGGTLEPVSMYSPKPEDLSTLKRTTSHSDGASCHSSISKGRSPRNRRLGFSFAKEMLLSFLPGSSIYNVEAAICSAVVVFPHHFGPSTSTAPLQDKISFRTVSATLGLYSVFFMADIIPYSRALRHLTVFHCVTCHYFIVALDGFSLRHLSSFRKFFVNNLKRTNYGYNTSGQARTHYGQERTSTDTPRTDYGQITDLLRAIHGQHTGLPTGF